MIIIKKCKKNKKTNKIIIKNQKLIKICNKKFNQIIKHKKIVQVKIHIAIYY